MSRNQTDVDIQRLRSELSRLQEEEEVLQQIINIVKTQLSAVQVENLEIKNRLPQPVLSQAELDQLVFTDQTGSELVLDQMVRGTFTLQDNQEEEEQEQYFGSN